ncbi:MAG: bifunctional phosphopantothenoylcysteine decarboxylase/phosphopantothenate--cysteine ligase CoaBC [Dehalococcoidales bacterium]|nr:bifunctional phosphopantothenoylcysteine decarboxylase/phosphopantothenate--cysteine ligase CoaBC [Dehalococcoidales bacterium]
MLTNKTIVLGVTGSVACYKAADLACKLTQAGAKVDVVMTDSAAKFINPLTFRSLTGRTVFTDMWDTLSASGVDHIALAEAADVVVIAPATANVIAELAAGIAGDSLTCTVLATLAPVIIAPAMHTGMWRNSITQENVAKLKNRNFTFIEPGYGYLASGCIGEGRLADIYTIMGTVRQVLGRTGNLAGKKIVVTAGGTREPIDPVRFLGNRSSGKMGHAVAEAARDRGAKVVLITGPTVLPDLAGVDIVRVQTAVQMKQAVAKAVAGSDALIMAAAVADFQPQTTSAQKIKKAAAGGKMTLPLVATPDILTETKGRFLKVGFAAETEDILENAKEKMRNKQLDLIVANDVTAPDSGFEVDTNRVSIIGPDSRTEDLPLMTKKEVADRLMDRIAVMLKPKPAPKGHTH